MTKLINLDALRDTPLISEPFPYVIVPNFLNEAHIKSLCDNFPDVPGPGSYPNNLLDINNTFQELVDEMESDELRKMVAEKFSMDLDDKPTMMTIRGACRNKDGKIHPDTKSKLITFLLYFNPTWEHEGGKLRILKDSNDIESTITEISPLAGTLLLFKVSDNSWHGHKSYQGLRRAIQMNYVTGQDIIDKESARHHFSAKMKKIKKLIGLK